MRWDKVVNIVFWGKFFKFFLLINAVAIVLLISVVVFMEDSVENGAQIVSAEGDCLENCVRPINVSAASNANAVSSSTSSATGGGGGSATVTVTQSQSQVQPPVARQKAPLVQAKELPRTGLPIVAWGIAALVPFGMKMRKFLSNSVKSQDDKPLFIAQKRKFTKDIN